MGENSIQILVYADWEELKGSKLLGNLFCERIRGKEVFSFSYEKSWLRKKEAIMLDPDLLNVSGQQFLQDEKPNFGLFLDSSPDRWGKVLLQRREAQIAKDENRNPKPLFETDFLLGVYDETRMGGLRFKLNHDGDFLDNETKYATPPITSLGELINASFQLEQENAIEKSDYKKWLLQLVAPGSSLGGARPKASVKDKNGNLWIAKFPSKNDNFNIGAWEKVTHQLAKNAGISVAEAQVQKIGSNHHTFLSKRFDRTLNNGRLHFASAMTMLGLAEGNIPESISYLNIAETIIKQGEKPKEDLMELWRRIVFAICVSNTDDHLRNHGFLLTKNGWRLSPAFDLNPNENGLGLSLNISEFDNALSIDLAMDTHAFFGLTEPQALKILKEVKDSIKNWKFIASEIGISRQEQVLKEPAFKLAFK